MNGGTSGRRRASTRSRTRAGGSADEAPRRRRCTDSGEPAGGQGGMSRRGPARATSAQVPMAAPQPPAQLRLRPARGPAGTGRGRRTPQPGDRGRAAAARGAQTRWLVDHRWRAARQDARRPRSFRARGRAGHVPSTARVQAVRRVRAAGSRARVTGASGSAAPADSSVSLVPRRRAQPLSPAPSATAPRFASAIATPISSPSVWLMARLASRYQGATSSPPRISATRPRLLSDTDTRSA
jgi:hypothetical protein